MNSLFALRIPCLVEPLTALEGRSPWINPRTEPWPISRSDRPETNNGQFQNLLFQFGSVK